MTETQDRKTPLYVIHSDADTVVPMGGTKAAADQLESNGSEVTFVVAKGLDHYDVPDYIDALKAAIPWIRERWGETE